MLETIREFARERLQDSGEAPSFWLRHAGWLIGLAESLSRDAEVPREWIDTIEREHDNIRPALERLHQLGATQLALELAAASWRFAFFASPTSVASGGGLVLERLALFPIHGTILWLATRPLPPVVLRLVAGAAIVAAVALLVLRWPAYQSLSDRSADYLAVAPCIARRSTLVQANLHQSFPPLRQVDPMIEETGVLSAATQGHDLGSVEGAVPFYPIRNRPSNDPYTFLTHGELPYLIPPPIDPLGYEERTDGRVDYILLNGRSEARPEVLASAQWLSLRQALDAGYRRVAVSPRGHLEVFERALPEVTAAGAVARTRAAGACPAVTTRPFAGSG